jgi:hypothetical protein
VVSSFINNAAHWRQRAEHIRALADDMRDPEFSATLLRIAEDYDRLARGAEGRLKNRAVERP